MKVLFATTNPAKAKHYVERLKEKGMDLITLKDLNLDLNVIEDGNNPVENAIIKAKAYFDATNIVTIAVDDGLYIDGLPDDKQPKNEVRRVNGKRLNDDEMIEYYTSVIKNLGGRANARWVKGVAICMGGEIKTNQFESKRVFLSTPCSIRNEGYPLDSITYWDEFKKYTVELAKDELDVVSTLKSTDKMVDFMESSILE